MSASRPTGPRSTSVTSRAATSATATDWKRIPAGITTSIARVGAERLEEPGDEVMELGGAQDTPGKRPLRDHLLGGQFGLIVGICAAIYPDDGGVDQVWRALTRRLQQLARPLHIADLSVLWISRTVDDRVHTS